MRAVVPAHVIVDHDDRPVKQSDIGSLAIHRTKETDSGPVNLMAIGYMLAASVDVCPVPRRNAGLGKHRGSRTIESQTD